MGSEFAIEVKNITKQFGRDQSALVALDNVSLTIKRGEFIALLGPSGCGKSTLLNIIAGLISFQKGSVLYENKEVSGPNTGVGYVTQHDTLLPWRSAASNLELPLELRDIANSERKDRIARYLATVELTRFADHYPREMSGGMRRRLLLARSLIYEPDALLMDEPFGALDAQLRLSMHELLQKIWMETRKTIVFVTHDIDEAVALADRVVVMTPRPGRIRSIVSIDIPRPRDIYRGRFDGAFQTFQTRLFDELDSAGVARISDVEDAAT